MRYLGHTRERKSDAKATGELSLLVCGGHFAIHGCDLGSVPCGKQLGGWAMDGKADRLLRRFHRRKSEPADGRESCRYHAIRRIGTGIWPGSAVARRGPTREP